MRTALEPVALGEFEQLVLLAVLCAGQDTDAYGVNVHSELQKRTKRRVARGAIYMTLDRLEKKGLLSSYLTDPTPERGGRAKRMVTLTPAGRRAAAEFHNAITAITEGIAWASPGTR